VFFGGVGPDSPDEQLRRIAPDHPVFRLTNASSPTPAPRIGAKHGTTGVSDK
jgi:hypothetical protein